MRILVIDDQRIFKYFPRLREIGAGDDVVHCDKSQDGLKLLYDEDWDEVWLDHDMGMDSDMNGTDLVNYIEQQIHSVEYGLAPGPNVGRFVVHSANPVGRDRMIRTLQLLGYKAEKEDPYPYLDDEAMDKKGKNPWLAGPNR